MAEWQTLTWGRLQVLEASFMAFRMLPEKAESEAAMLPWLGERPWERHFHGLIFAENNCPHPPDPHNAGLMVTRL